MPKTIALNIVSILTAIILVFLLFIPQVFAWEQLDQGLWLGEFESSQKSLIGDSKVTVLKINPKLYSLTLISSSEQNIGSMTVEKWSEKFDLIALLNASMYLQDHETSTGYMKNYKHINNSNINSEFGAFLAFNPINEIEPEVQIIDKYHQNWKGLIKKYNTVIQNYRMISIKQENVWSQQKNMYSIACVGIDMQRNVLFIHTKSPYSVHDFNNIILNLPLDINNVMYVEGGPEASLFVKTNDFIGKWMGSYETGFFDNSNTKFWPIPNVIGIKRKSHKDIEKK
ncbi:phosphodiester glycosidase family protein [Candidatus Latescibacterota bacterium]